MTINTYNEYEITNEWIQVFKENINKLKSKKDLTQMDNIILNSYKSVLNDLENETREFEKRYEEVLSDKKVIKDKLN